MSELHIQYVRINEAWLLLKGCWEEVSTHWHDVQKIHFESNSWNKCEEGVQEYLQHLLQIAVLFDQIKKQFNIK